MVATDAPPIKGCSARAFGNGGYTDQVRLRALTAIDREEPATAGFVRVAAVSFAKQLALANRQAFRAMNQN